MSSIASFSSGKFALGFAPRGGRGKGSPGAEEGKRPDGTTLSADQQKQVQDLKKRDAEVREHEAAHLAAAGGYARGGASYDFQTGPDGLQYAVGGHVDIDASPVKGDPRATIAKAQIVERAALAPADPSAQDRAVAAEAAQEAANAQQEIAQQKSGKKVVSRGKFTVDAHHAYAASTSDPETSGTLLNVLG